MPKRPPESIPCTKCKRTVCASDEYKGLCYCHDTLDRGSPSFRCTACGKVFTDVYCSACLAEDFWARD